MCVCVCVCVCEVSSVNRVGLLLCCGSYLASNSTIQHPDLVYFDTFVLKALPIPIKKQLRNISAPFCKTGSSILISVWAGKQEFDLPTLKQNYRIVNNWLSW